MNRKFFLSAIASGVLALAMGGNAVAASIEAAPRTQTPARAATANVTLEAGTDISSVQLHFAGARMVTFQDIGTLRVLNEDGTSWQYRPLLYQVVNGKRHVLNPGFRIFSNDRVGLRVSGYDPSVPLILGPVGPKS